MIGAWVRYLILLIFGLGGSACSTDNQVANFNISEEIEGKPLAIIIGEPKKFEYLGTPDLGPDYVAWSSWYEVTFTSYDVIFGEVPKGKLKVPLLFHAFPRKKLKIFVLLEAEEGKEVKGLYWGFPREQVCIYGKDFEVIEEKYPDGPAKEKLKEFLKGEYNNCYLTGRLIE